jgi:hypothetical protein
MGELGVGDFDRDVAAQAGIVGAIHFAHATFADQSQNFVRTEFVVCNALTGELAVRKLPIMADNGIL